MDRLRRAEPGRLEVEKAAPQVTAGPRRRHPRTEPGGAAAGLGTMGCHGPPSAARQLAESRPTPPGSARFPRQGTAQGGANPLLAGLLDVAAYAGHRLSEQSVHAWDIGIALGPSAAVPTAETAPPWERSDLMAGRFSHAGTRTRLAPQRIRIKLTDTGRTLFPDIDDEVHIYPVEPADPTGSGRPSRGGPASDLRPQPFPGPTDHGRPSHRRRPAHPLPRLLSRDRGSSSP